MKMRVLLTSCCTVAALLLPELSLGEDYFLYQPQPVTGEKVPSSPEEGVLVRRVTVRRGDTLQRIARKYIGKGWLFPQVLLFSKVKNPDLIYPGEKLLVPVSTAAVGTPGAAKKTMRSKKRRGAAEAQPQGPVEPRQLVPKSSGTQQSLEPVAPEQKTPVPRSRESERRSNKESAPPLRLSGTPSAEQAIYQSAKTAYSQGEYRKAADLFSDFLRRYPNSPLAADVALYRADCFLHLSGQ